MQYPNFIPADAYEVKQEGQTHVWTYKEPIKYNAEGYRKERRFNAKGFAQELASHLGDGWALDPSAYEFAYAEAILRNGSQSIVVTSQGYGVRPYSKVNISGWIRRADAGHTSPTLFTMNFSLSRGVPAIAKSLISRGGLKTLADSVGEFAAKDAEKAAARGRLTKLCAKLSKKYESGLVFKLDGKCENIDVWSKFGGNVHLNRARIYESTSDSERVFRLTSPSLTIENIETATGRALLAAINKG